MCVGTTQTASRKLNTSSCFGRILRQLVGIGALCDATPGVYARGTVRHSDHETITLPVWHRVIMNTETQSRTMANVAFLD